MRSAYNLLLALAASTFLLASCKKSSSDPSPTPGDTTTVSGCKLTLVIDDATKKPLHRYGYDSHDRLNRYANFTGSRPDSAVVTVTYNDNGTIDLAGGPSQAIRLSGTSGKFSQLVGGSSFNSLTDTTFLKYNAANQLTRIYNKDVFNASISFQDITYGSNGLPSVVTNGTDSAGTTKLSYRTTYTYDDRKTVSYNPYSPFVFGPGLEFVKITKLYLKSVFENLDSEGSYTTNYTNDFDSAGNVSTVTAKDDGPSQVSRFYTSCNK